MLYIIVVVIMMYNASADNTANTAVSTIINIDAYVICKDSCICMRVGGWVYLYGFSPTWCTMVYCVVFFLQL